MFREQKEISINLNDEHIDFLFTVKEISPVVTARVYFKGKILKGSVKPKDILAITDNTGKILAQGCPVMQTLIGEQECGELSKDSADEVGLFVGVHLNPGEYSGLILLKSEIVESMQSQTVHAALKVITASRKQHDSLIAEKESDANLLSDGELIAIFSEHFAPRTDFHGQMGSEKYKAYFGAINAAIPEMLNNPQLYYKATKRKQADLLAMCNNRITGITNSLLCGLIFSMGKYAVIQSSMICVDFAEAIPNCIAIYLLLTAQKLPPNNRKQVIDAGDGVNTQPLITAMDALSVCDPHWKYSIH